jgi:hypothetical protein
MSNKINTIPLGVGNVYIVRDKGTIMIDSGEQKKSKVFLKGLKEASIVDVTLDDKELSLAEYGISGKVVYTLATLQAL